ncbi:MAG TPA: hypothetical protein VGH84_05710 [Steroidobacteraceae bacterium]
MKKPHPDPTEPAPAKPNSELSLEDTIAQRSRGVTPRVKSVVSGYNPYDAIPTKPGSGGANKPTDLRKLSEWIRLTRQVEALKKEKPG